VTQPRAQWSHQWGFVLAACGAAVGLGNIWKFPYMVGSHGGSAFVLVYLLAVIFVGVPILAAEILIGRRAKKNPIDALMSLARESSGSKHWRLLGFFGLFGLLLTLSFYSVVAGWSVYYLCLALKGGLNALEPDAITAIWTDFLSSPLQLLFYHAIFMIMTLFVVAKGIQKGIERASMIMMPILFCVLIFLVIYSGLTFGTHFKEAFLFLFEPDFSKITPSVALNAVGHAFFTMAIGVGAMCIYGSYIPRTISIGYSIVMTTFLDVLVALLTGLALYPIIFAHHLAPDSGPGLMFMTLPISFTHMPQGQSIGALFFLLLLFAAWTSSINIAEPLIASLCERAGYSRSKACWIVGAVAWTLGIVSVLSFNVWESVRIAGVWTPFGLITDAVTNVILPLGGIGFCIFSGWVMKSRATQEELATSPWIFKIWRVSVRYIAPIALIVVFLSQFFASV
jgi:NSS family neurotransmitter:Na+ symporter